MKRSLNTALTVVAIVIFGVLGYFIFINKSAVVPPKDLNSVTVSNQPIAPIEYTNNQYGFNFTLPASWKGYAVINDEWVGNASGPQGDVVSEKGPLLSIRHPLWTAAKPRQDIPIMVLTLAQWNSLQKDKFHIGAAPIGPQELGKNNKYVFALPARYNFAFITGYQEVARILSGNPLKAF
jgi:hypothetical protein